MEKNRERSSFHFFTSQVATTARTGPRQSQEPGPPSSSPTCWSCHLLPPRTPHWQEVAMGSQLSGGNGSLQMRSVGVPGGILATGLNAPSPPCCRFKPWSGFDIR